MGNVGPRFADVPVHLAHDTNVLVTVEKGVFLFALDAQMTGAGVRGLVCFKARVRKDDNQALRVLVRRRDGDMLLGDKLGELGRRKRLGS